MTNCIMYCFLHCIEVDTIYNFREEPHGQNLTFITMTNGDTLHALLETYTCDLRPRRHILGLARRPVLLNNAEEQGFCDSLLQSTLTVLV